MSRFHVTYMDTDGAGCVRYFQTQNEMQRFVEKLRREATIYRDGQQIGSVERTDTADDRRIKWLWSFENEEDVLNAS